VFHRDAAPSRWFFFYYEESSAAGAEVFKAKKESLFSTGGSGGGDLWRWHRRGFAVLSRKRRVFLA
jgi:hypothetical protein